MNAFRTILTGEIIRAMARGLRDCDRGRHSRRHSARISLLLRLPARALLLIGLVAAATPKEVRSPLPSVHPVPGAPFVHAGPMVGHVSPDSAILWVKASNKTELSFRVGTKEDLSDARVTGALPLVEETVFAGSLVISQLKPSSRYYYAPMLDGQIAITRPFPAFVTAPIVGSSNRLRVALASCVGRYGYDAAAAWGEMAARGNFDVLLMLGDNHYGDTTNPQLLRDNYFEHRTVAGFASLIRKVPTYAIWDDHDFGPNNSDGTAIGKESSLRVFQQWWANASYGEAINPGIYGRVSRGDIDFFFLDVRYHRTPNRLPDDGTKTMLGARQLAWLKQELFRSRAKFKIVASGSEFQTLTQSDCWSSFSRERQEIFDHITGNGIEGVVLVSGDRHFTAGYQVQKRFLEFTSGPIGAGNATFHPNPERFTGSDEGKLWVILELDTTAPVPSLAYEIWQAGGGLLERRGLSWDEVNGRSSIAPTELPLLSARMEKKPPASGVR